jgi:hypothetical protein
MASVIRTTDASGDAGGICFLEKTLAFARLDVIYYKSRCLSGGDGDGSLKTEQRA